MKKLLYILLAVASIGCSKQDDFATQGNDNEAVSFTIIEDETRADHKTEWVDDEEVAIFEGDATTSRKYTVDTSNGTTLVPADGVEAYISPSAETTYTVYYPYKASSTDYETLAEDVIKASATLEAGSTSASLTFSHVNCYITVNTPDITSAATVTISNSTTTILSNATISNKTYGFYHAPIADLSGYTITVTADGTDYYTSATTTDITAWVAGTPYTYNIYRSADIIYTGGVCEIYTAKGLATFSDIVLSGADAHGSTIIGGSVDDIITAATDKSKINGKLKAHIDLSSICNDGGGGSWSPIGQDGKNYSGTFDGNGFEVRNLYISASTYFQGLFGYTSNATIKNLGVTGSVTTSGTTASEDYGGIVGYATSTTITNCYNKATISGYKCSGGIVGGADGGTIENCYNAGSVTGSNIYTGGIVGYTSSSSSSVAINSCYNIGDINGDNNFTGGIVGQSGNSSNTIYNCYNLGDVTADGTCSGGIVGNNIGTIINCYNAGDISSSSTDVGGVVGWNSSTGTVVNVYNLGSVTGTSSIGGLVGSHYGATLKIGYNVGEVESTSSSSSIGSIVGNYSSTESSDCYYLNTLTADSYGTPYSELVMKNADFVDELNKLAEVAWMSDDTSCYWKAVDSNYPTLNFGTIAESGE